MRIAGCMDSINTISHSGLFLAWENGTKASAADRDGRGGRISMLATLLQPFDMRIFHLFDETRTKRSNGGNNGHKNKTPALFYCHVG